MRRSLTGALAALVMACASPPPAQEPFLVGPVADPCIGASFDAARLPEKCRVRNAVDLRPLPKNAVRVQPAAPPTVRSGTVGTLDVVLENVTSQRITIDVDNGCRSMEAVVVGFPSACGHGFCDHPEGDVVWRITLEPKGIVRAKVDVVAEIGHGTPQGRMIVCGASTPLPPGQYPIRIGLPWQTETIEETLTVAP